jgi:hypothetical protein
LGGGIIRVAMVFLLGSMTEAERFLWGGEDEAD